MFRDNEFFGGADEMKKLPLPVRILLGAASVLVSVAVSWFLEPFLGDMSLFLILPGAAVFIWLNPELMRGD